MNLGIAPARGWRAVLAVVVAALIVCAVASIDPWGYQVGPSGDRIFCAPVWRELPDTPICPTRVVGNEHR